MPAQGRNLGNRGPRVQPTRCSRARGVAQQVPREEWRWLRRLKTGTIMSAAMLLRCRENVDGRKRKHPLTGYQWVGQTETHLHPQEHTLSHLISSIRDAPFVRHQHEAHLEPKRTPGTQ